MSLLKMHTRGVGILKRTKLCYENIWKRSLAIQVAAKMEQTRIYNTPTEYSKAIPFSKIPGPSAFEFIKSNFLGGKLYKTDFREMLRIFREDYGDLMKMPGVLGQPAIVVSHNPDHFQSLFRTEGHWPERRGLQIMQYYREKIRPDVYGKYQGLVNAQGKEWGEFRTAVNPVLMQPKTTQHYIPTIDEVATDFLERVRKIRNPTTQQLPSNFQSELNKWTFESIGVIALDTRLGLLTGQPNATATEFMSAVKRVFEFTVELEFKPSLWRIYPTKDYKNFINDLEIITNIANKYTRDARNKLNAKSSSGNEDHELSVLEKLLKIDENIATVMAMDMIFAGVDATSSAFTGLLYGLAKNPDKQKLLREEIMNVLPHKESPLKPENMRNLPYLRACMKEAQRLFPTAIGNMRAAGQDIVLDGYKIPKGTHVMMSFYPLLTDFKYYPDATKFIPERWLKQDTGENKCPSAKSAHPFVYLPFGFGSRMCIGRRLAEMEIAVLISKMIRNFDVSWEHPDLHFKCTSLNVPDGELMFTLNDIKK